MGILPDIQDGKLIEIKHKPKEYKGGPVNIYLAPTKKSKRKKKREQTAHIPKKYHAYITSKWWSLRKRIYFKKYDKSCAVCSTRVSIDLHHMIYGNYGIEKDEHLVSLCREHHHAFHEKVGVKGNMLKETHQFIIEEKELLDLKNLLDSL